MNKILILPLIAVLMLSGCKNKEKATEKKSAKVEASKEKKIAVATADYEAAAEVEESPVPAEIKQEVDISKYQPKYSENLYFRFKRTPCFGQCPTYEVNVYRDGHAVLEGKAHFDYQGYYQTSFTEDQLNRLLALAKQYGFFEFDHVYDAPVTDLPSTTTIIQAEGATNWVYHRMNAPDELRTLETELETFIKDLQWYPYKPEKSQD